MNRRPRERSREKPQRPSRPTRERQERRVRTQRVSLDRRSITPEKPRDNTVDAIKASLQSSLESTDAGLRRFLDSVQQSGLEQVIQDYRSLQGVLLQQCRWAHSNDADELLPLFESIGRTATDLHRIFSAYADIMRPLKQLGSAVPPSLPVVAAGSAVETESDALASAAHASTLDVQQAVDLQQESVAVEMSEVPAQDTSVQVQTTDTVAPAKGTDESHTSDELVASAGGDEGTETMTSTVGDEGAALVGDTLEESS